MIGARLRARLRRRRFAVWYDPDYRLPLAGLEAQLRIEPRRAELALSWLIEARALRARSARRPAWAPYQALARVHDLAYLESLGEPSVIAGILGVEDPAIQPPEVLHSMRLGCGGTLEAARYAVREGRPALNLLGGFHHAAPGHGGGLCALNDVAIALAALRADGLEGRAAVLDLDAHPPDGLALCLADEIAAGTAWIGSISGSDWGPLAGVDETLLPPRAEDGAYLAALDALLERAPRPAIAFVIAGGDVLAGDPLGLLGLSLEGARERDRRVARWLDDTPAVWLPGGGYQDDAWRVLAGTGLVLAGLGDVQIPDDVDPLALRFASISERLEPGDLSGEWLTEEDLGALFGHRPPRLLLGFYTPAGIERGLFEFGVLRYLRRLGYDDLRISLERSDVGERVALSGEAGGERHRLVELVLERTEIGGAPMLYVHWLTLRHPISSFTDDRPRLPGQEVPGLGLAREVSLMLARIAERLVLEGVAYRPAWLHTAYAGRGSLRFVDPARQGRFLALLRDLRGVGLAEMTAAADAGRIERVDAATGEAAPYTWEADPMARWLEPRPAEVEAAYDAAVASAAARVRFRLTADEAGGGAPG